jgi:broad specificity phosphatase PhoE
VEGRLRDEIAANDPVRYHALRNDPANVAFEAGETIAQVRALGETLLAPLSGEFPRWW